MKNRKHEDLGDAPEVPPVQNLIEFLQASPLAKAAREDGIDFEIERDRDVPRDIDLE